MVVGGFQVTRVGGLSVRLLMVPLVGSGGLGSVSVEGPGLVVRGGFSVVFFGGDQTMGFIRGSFEIAGLGLEGGFWLVDLSPWSIGVVVGGWSMGATDV